MVQLTFSQHKSLAGIVVCVDAFLAVVRSTAIIVGNSQTKTKNFQFFCFMSLLQSGYCGFARLQLRNVQPIYSDTTSLNLSHDLLR